LGLSPEPQNEIVPLWARTLQNKGINFVWLWQNLDAVQNSQMKSCLYDSTSDELSSTYSMMLRHSSLVSWLVVDALALPNWPWKRLSFD
jgi:hypothetical protein